jgi:tripartite-type tricarboxylate transporter receptor subunit TctC
MKKKNIIVLIGGAAVLLALILGGLIARQHQGGGKSGGGGDVAGFYKGNVIEWIIPYNPGGGYDEYVRLLAPYMEKHTGARVDVLNLPGAGGMRGVNELYDSPRDGLTIGIINGSAMVTNQLAGVKGAEYKIGEFEFLGRVVADRRVLVVSSNSDYTSFDDFLNADKPIRIGATGLGGSTYVDAVISKEAFNLDNLEIIHGFDSSPVVRQAMLRGNIVGTWGSWGSAEDAVDSGREKVILQSGRQRSPDLPDAPTVFELADRTRDPERTRAILTAWDALMAVGRPVAAPPGTNPERLAFLREAFRKVMHDPELIKAAEKAKRPLDYASGKEMGKIARDATEMPEDIKQLFIRAIKGQL